MASTAGGAGGGAGADAAVDADAVKAMREERLRRTLEFYSAGAADNSNMPTLDADFSKSVGGSAVEMRQEKQMGNLLRGEDKDGDVATMPVYMDEDDGTGKWVKFMSSKGCNCYCHSITCQVLFSRPSEYESDEEEVDASSIPKVKLTAIADEVDKVIASGKTPLLIDPSGDGNVRAFYEYKGSVLDLQDLFKGPVLGGLSAKDAKEEARKGLVAALKNGSTLVLYMGSAVPKLNKFTGPTTFPTEIFQQGSMADLKTRKKVYKPDDKEGGLCAFKPEFKVVAVTTFGPDDFHARLSKQLPMDNLHPLLVV